MPSEADRKLLKNGTSRVVTLPASYCRYHRLNHGDTVRVLWDSLLLIIPAGMEHIADERRRAIDEVLGFKPNQHPLPGEN